MKMVNNRLKEIMQQRRKNSTELADIIGISERNMRRIVAGGTTSDESVAALARALDVSADYLLGLSDDPSPHMRIDNMSDEERAVVAAMRRGDDKAAMKIIASR